MERSFKVNCLALLNIKDSKIPRNTALTVCYILTLVMLDLLTSHNALGLVSAAFAIGLVLRSYFARPRLPHSSKLPPGPALLPILGSALAVDVTAPWLTYKAWGSQYGKLSPCRSPPVINVSQVTWYILGFLVRTISLLTLSELQETSLIIAHRITPTDQRSQPMNCMN